MRILVIEDEEKLSQYLKKGLEQDGYAVDCVGDGEAGEQRIKMGQKDYDLVILDLMLPKKNGFEVCRDVRQEGVNLPIIILTARDTTEDRVTALDSGADDYLAKPFSFEELSARIRALLRRPAENIGTELRVADLVLSPSERTVSQGNRKIELTLKEFELLQYFMRHPNQVLSREDIYSHLWDFADNSLSNTIDAHVKNLRRKLDDTKDEKVIETIRGVGYRIRA